MASLSTTRTATRAAGICRQCRLQLERQSTRHFTTTGKLRRVASVSIEAAGKEDDNSQALPRWARTPQAMKAPFRVNPPTKNDDYYVNEDPRKLDEIYIKLFGKDGDKWLPEEIKWLAVTHKSFDHGRRGFNDRLSFLGRRIMELQTSLALLDAPKNPLAAAHAVGEDEFGREPFQHPALANIENISSFMKDQSLEKTRLSALAERYGLGSVVRWKPRQTRNLKTSGIDAVMTHTLYAIIGAVALQRGGEVANQFVRERVLTPLGLM